MMDPKSTGTHASVPTSPVPGGADNDQSGEGNYEASRLYNEGLKKSVEKGDADALAEEARKALEGPEGDELRKADELGKQGGNKPVSR